jgi:hypothetical protein
MSRENRWRNAVIENCKGRCPHCGRKGTGGVHHVFSRSIEKLKYVLENGIYCCWELHRDFENPDRKFEVMKKYVGDIIYFKLLNIVNGRLTIEEAKFTVIE